MRKRFRLSIVALVAICSTPRLVAQQANERVQSINTIKRDTSYIYAEATMKDPKEAYDGALAILEMRVADWVHTQHPDEEIEVCVIKAKEHSQKLETRRGSFYRAFVYVKKSDIMTAMEQSEITVMKMELPKITETAEDTEVSSTEKQSADMKENVTTEAAPTITLTPEEEKMKNIKTFAAIEPYIKGLKSKGWLTAYGKYSNMPEGEDCYLFVYNKVGEVVAALRKTSECQLNLNTLENDNIKNYKNCGAIWFQFK